MILPSIQQLEIDLPEIQEIDARKIIEAKLQEALKHQEGAFIVEDTSFYLEALNGLPGPLIKWFEKAIGNEGIFQLAAKLGNTRAIAKTMIGYAKNAEEIYFFEGTLEGEVVSPSQDNGFGWDVIFQPQGHTRAFSEFTLEEKNAISMRRKAFDELAKFLQDNK
jgi:non-canonical purine NTP pyrophosphatase (RdgB/HAM1 family)